MKYRIREKRKAAGMTQADMAERLSISLSLYSMLETGKRRMNETYLAGIAKILGERPSSLIIDEGAEAIDEFVTLFLLLDDAEQDKAISYMRFLSSPPSNEEQADDQTTKEKRKG